jgi:adenylate cyclase class IV
MSENIETEVKIEVDDTTFYRIYKELNSHILVEQKNLIYRNENSILRLRQESDKTILTIKGIDSGINFNSRPEVEAELAWNAFEEMRQLMPDAFYYEKRRATVREPHCVICFDILHNGRKYIEIEADEARIKKYIKKFGLEDFPREKRSYLELLMGEK